MDCQEITFDGRCRMRDDRMNPQMSLPDLRDTTSGRIDAQRVAAYMGVPPALLAEGLGLVSADVHKMPDEPGRQVILVPIIRILEMADAVLGGREAVVAWLHRPLDELEAESPAAVILAGEAGAVATLLENAIGGIPG